VGGDHPKTPAALEEADQPLRGRRPLSWVGVPDRLAAVDRPGEVEPGGDCGQARQLVPVEGESLGVGIELPDATKPEPAQRRSSSAAPGSAGWTTPQPAIRPG